MVCNDSHIVLVHMHYHCWVEYLLSCLKLFLRFLFVSELILTWIGWASAGRLQEDEVRTMVLMEDNDDNEEEGAYSSASSLLSSSRRCFLLFL